MSCLSDQTSITDCKQTDQSMNKQCPLQNREARHSLIPDELWITSYLQNASLKFLTLKYNTSVSFSPLYRQLETQVISGQLLWKLTSPKSMTHVSNPWSLTHSAALVLLRIWAEGLLWPSRSIVTPRLSSRVWEDQMQNSKRQRAMRVHAADVLALL